jgi:formate dehydrogenase major subunit
VPGLGISLGRGGATTSEMDVKFADSILIMGSNMAECHPVAFRFVMQAKAAGAQLMHVDPRFTRTSALANTYVPLRAGTDIVFLGALINYIVNDARWNSEPFFRDYLTNYTNAPTLIKPEYQGPDDLDGLFSGFNADTKKYDTATWAYQSEPAATPSTQPDQNADDAQNFASRVGKLVGGQPLQDRTLQDPNTVFQILKRHYARYTPELVEQVCGTPAATFRKVAETLLANSGADKTSCICYAVGWTQHTTGVQLIRTATLVQLLLGNIGRPGGGILALRGHASIQGSTDIPTLYNLQPGYLNTPNAQKKHDTLGDYIETEVTPTAYWVNFPKFIVSQLKAWFGDAATPENQFGYDWLPKVVGDHSHMPMLVEMSQGNVQGMFAMGQNPAVGGQNAGFQRRALGKLKWLVVRDLFETETASFWKDSPEVKSGEMRPEDIQTEVFFLPAAAVPEMDGSYTNTFRLLQWHDRASDPPGDARSDLWFTFHLGQRLKQLYKGSAAARDQGFLNLTWDYLDPEENEGWAIKDEPSATRVLQEINGFTWADKKLLKGFGDLKDDGSTACGAWIYSGVFAPTAERPEGENRAASRKGDDWVALGWGFAWPANRRVMYNRASADPAGNPWPKEARLAQQHSGGKYRGYVYYDAAAPGGNDAQGNAITGAWVGLDVPDFPTTKRPDFQAKEKAPGLDFHDGASPFIMKGDGKGWLFAPSGAVDGPLPTHYEPYESPVQNQVYKQQSNPVAKVWEPADRLAPVGSPDYPHILSTYRLTEHHLSGSMSRWLPWLAELQPELFAEISPEHAAELGIANTDRIKIHTPRATISAKALVTKRARPYVIGGKTIHYVGLPWHWGYKGIAVGDVVNDLAAMVGDPNVSIHEAKVFVCNVTKG